MNQLAKRQSQLPATIEDLSIYVLVGEQQIKAHQAKVRASKTLPDAQKYETAAIQEGQAFAETVIIAKSRLGELLAARPLSEKRASSAKGTCSLPTGITKKISHEAQTIANNQAVVQQVIAKAKEENRIPTPNEVVKAVNKKPPKQKSTDWNIMDKRNEIEAYLKKQYDIWPDVPTKGKGFRKLVESILKEILHD